MGGRDEREYCNVCENFPCLGNHPPGEIERESYRNWLMRYNVMSMREALAPTERAAAGEAGERPGESGVLAEWPVPPPWVFRETFPVVVRRSLEERDRRDWIEAVRHRLGLVAEVHRCRVWRDELGWWKWWCRRPGCPAGAYMRPQPEALPCSSQTRSLMPARSYRSHPNRNRGPNWTCWAFDAIGARILPAGKWIPWLDLTGRGPRA